MTIRLALIGFGKIAQDQHLPVVQASPAFTLAATVSKHGQGIDGTPHFEDLADLIASGIAVDAVSICTPPQVRRAVALQAIAQGWHVFLEKPPASTLAEVELLRTAAEEQAVTLFASWHSRYAPAVEPARTWLAEREIRAVKVTWREDVRVWHPGQQWIWQPGGFGVFDPGINALSIVTHILPRPLVVEQAALDIPENLAAPIAARVSLRDTAGVPVVMDLDFRQEGPQSWDIAVETDAGTLTLSKGGDELALPDGDATLPAAGDHAEYAALYARFADLVQVGASDVDVTPLRLVADAFLSGRHDRVEALIE
ncbi:Gfo/Idh/MocA family protein [Sphingomonas sp. CCH5-D11]|uniref:Gfo/Idh/MocA family protein n=1 Tax=Sphingomonas sp. CCH5-D11 TaxID=1768786 RepID=UPI00082AEA64|nr:Gfo/Idh/MocA family oxidoreductase [Sphingomonas sp. CCH5-D11]